MANPTFVNCAKDAWTKVATNVIKGQIHIDKIEPIYSSTYRVTGDPVPTLASDGVTFIGKSQPIIADSTSPIDVYIYCKKAAGRVRVDV